MSTNRRGTGGTMRTLGLEEKKLRDQLKEKIKIDADLFKLGEKLWDEYERKTTVTDSEKLLKRKEEFFRRLNEMKSESEASIIQYESALDFMKSNLEKLENLIVSRSQPSE